MAEDFRTPKYLREFVLSRCLGCTVKIEAIAREWTKQNYGSVPAFGTKELQEYAIRAGSNYKQIRKAAFELVKAKQATMPHEGFIYSTIEQKGNEND